MLAPEEERTGGPEGALGLLGRMLRAPSLAELAGRSASSDLLAVLVEEESSFYSVYQPIVRLATREVVGHEGLLRAVGPGGQLSPLDMFAAATAAGWVHVLDRVGRTTVLSGAKGWLGDDLLFVNFVPTSIYRPEVCLRTTERAARAAGLRMDQVVFEITEGEQVRDLSHLERVFDYYREQGCKVALDDLGSGFSSLNVMVRLRPDVAKLDRELVQQLPAAGATAVVRAAAEICHAAGGLLLAEGVETEEQAASAAALGADLAQGWLFGRPVPGPSGPASSPASRAAPPTAPAPTRPATTGWTSPSRRSRWRASPPGRPPTEARRPPPARRLAMRGPLGRPSSRWSSPCAPI